MRCCYLLVLLLSLPLSLYSQFKGYWYAHTAEDFVRLEIHRDYLVTIKDLKTIDDGPYSRIDVDTIQFVHKEQNEGNLYILGKGSGPIRFARFTVQQECRCLKTGYFGFSIEELSSNKASFRKAVEASKKGKPGLTFHQAAAMDSFTHLKKLQNISEEELVSALERFYQELQSISGMVQNEKIHNRPERVLPAYRDIDAAHLLILAFMKEGFSPIFDKEAVRLATSKYGDNQRIRKLAPKIEEAMDSF